MSSYGHETHAGAYGYENDGYYNFGGDDFGGASNQQEFRAHTSPVFADPTLDLEDTALDEYLGEFRLLCILAFLISGR